MLNQFVRKSGYVPAANASLFDDSRPHRHRRCRRTSATVPHSTSASRGTMIFAFTTTTARIPIAMLWDVTGWAPVAVAGLMLAKSDRCARMAMESVASRLWIAQDAPALVAWREANAEVFDTLRGRVVGTGLPDTSTYNAPDPERQTVTLLGTAEIASLFAMCWQRARSESPRLFLANSRAYVSLATHHAMRGASESAEHALERALDWVIVWFESRGMAVDRARRLVNIPGYEALLYRACQAL